MRAASIAAAILAAAVAASAGAAFIPKMPDFVRGADVSSITEMEKRGDRVSSALGVEADGFRIMRRARMAGLQVMLAFHYSDVYATAERQEIPGVWSNLDAAGLSRAVYMHTAQVLALMKRNHIVPLWVQVGNAVNDGFLWPAARMSENPKVFADVFESGYKAVKAVFPKTAVLIHFDRGHDFGLFDRNLSLLRKHHVPWDVAACSVFPSKCREERPDADKLLMDILDVLKKVGYDFNCDTMIAELGLECSPETYTESRRRLTALLFEASKVRRCRGVFYYEPMLRKGDAGNPLGAFDGRGFPTPIMEGFRPVYRNF